MILLRLLLLPLIVLIGSCASVSASNPPAPREQGFVIAANPLAARAGMEVLERGGSAVDAAIAVQAMLSLVEPQSSGLGGGAFMNYYDASTRNLTIYDGREVAPAQATPGMFLDQAGKPLRFDQAVLSGRATGVPGAVAMLATWPIANVASFRGAHCSVRPSVPPTKVSLSARGSESCWQATLPKIARPMSSLISGTPTAVV